MTLHHQAQGFIAAVAAAGGPGWHEQSPAEGRAVFASFKDFWGDAPELQRVEEISVGENLKVRLYAAEKQTSDQPVVMYFHGGGWVLGDVDVYDCLCRQLAIETGFVIASVDYGLAPENKFPGPMEDCYAATEHVFSNAESLGIDRSRIAVAGDSAGGNLAAAVAMKARDQNGPPIRFQLLIYPVIEPDFETESYQKFGTGHVLTMADMKWFWQQYLRENSDAENPLASPSKAESHVGLPPVHVITAQYDPLRDEGEGYASMLADAGVLVTQKQYPGMLHGFVHFRGLFDDGEQAMTDIANELKKHLSNEASS